MSIHYRINHHMRCMYDQCSVYNLFCNLRRMLCLVSKGRLSIMRSWLLCWRMLCMYLRKACRRALGDMFHFDRLMNKFCYLLNSTLLMHLGKKRNKNHHKVKYFPYKQYTWSKSCIMCMLMDTHHNDNNWDFSTRQLGKKLYIYLLSLHQSMVYIMLKLRISLMWCSHNMNLNIVGRIDLSEDTC